MPPFDHGARRRLRATCRCLAACAALSGCAVGPDFERPAAPAVERYTAQPVPAATAATAARGGEAQALRLGAQLPAQWWRLFGSPRLDALVEEAFAGSPSLLAAQATLQRAQELLRAQYGTLLPAVDAGVSANRQKSYVDFGEPGVIGPLNTYRAGIDVAYALDLFGGARRALEAQRAQVDVQTYELQATYLTLASNVVTTAVQEASLRAQLEAMRALIAAQEQRLDLSEKQYGFGAISMANLLSVRAELASLRAQLPPLEQALAATRTQLAVYLGKLPVQHEQAPFALDELTLPRELPLGVPSELVRRRPDVLAAEAQLHRASAEVGVATANLFPQLTLSGSYGGSSGEFSELFDNPVWSLGANLTQPLFHGGALNAQRRAAEAAYAAALQDYRQTVLNAFKNVADALQAVIADADAVQAQHAALAAADASLELSDRQYRLGGSAYLELLLAQRQAQQARIDYVRSLGDRYQSTAALLYALAGDWRGAAPGAADPLPNDPAGGATAAPATQE